MTRLFLAAAALAAGSLLQLPPAAAQQSPDWFVPSQAQPRAAPGRPEPRVVPHPAPRQAPRAAPAPVEAASPPAAASPDAAPPDEQAQQTPNLPLPPVPDLPALPKGAAPPAAVIGVLGVPEVMRASTAAQQVQKVIGERRDKLNQDAQKEQGAWRDLQQQLANQRSSLSAEQIRGKERDLQERITNAQRSFRDRNRIIQDAAQVALGQIERELIAVIRQVAESRGMNLVLHRAQVALNINEFDITDQVTQQLNKVLPSVTIPPDGQEPTAANMGLAASPASAPAAHR
ncbi:MAG: OmpH family outer membrane protein [Acidisphaera sp.]|nr:OmpH family outer membrane protein [Acidisphaera sp.]